MVSPSDEQQSILDAVREGNNILGDCVAGSGKTTTVLMIAKEFPDKNIVLLTYNAALKLEVREKIEHESITNLRSHSYHSANGTYYSHFSKTSNYDDAIRCVIKHKRPLRNPSLSVDILIIDETQDMKKLFFHFAWKFYIDLDIKPQLVVFGDRFQGLYSFIGSDTRYLTQAAHVWKQPFVERSLSTSYRVTHPIASFVNEVLLGYPRIRAVRDGPNVSYWRIHPFRDVFVIYNFIKEQLNKGYLPGDIFVLCPTLNGNARSPVRLLENMIAMDNIPCYYPTTDDSVLDKEVIQNKVVFSSFHQSKGRERKIVIVTGFDANYFKYFAKDVPTTVCPDALYVAVTRAKEKLVVVQSSLDPPLQFLFKTPIQMASIGYIDMTPSVSENIRDQPVPESRNTSPTDIIRFVTDENLLLLKSLVEPGITIVQDPTMSIGVELKLKTCTGTEDVSAINGIVIPMIQEYRRTQRKSSVQKVVESTKSCLLEHREQPFFQKYIEKWDASSVDIRSDIYLAILFTVCTNQLYHKLTQIDSYDWLTYEQIQPCIDLLDEVTSTSKNLSYERKLNISTVSKKHGRVNLEGRMDICDDETVWEVKCVENLTFDHELQLVVYAWMWKNSVLEPRKFKLINVRSGEIRELNYETIDLDAVMEVLFDNKYVTKNRLTDLEFFNSLADVYEYCPHEPQFDEDDYD